MTDVELQPEESEVLQREDLTAIPVDVRGPVRVQGLPLKSATARSVTLSTTPRQILSADHYRGRTVLMLTGSGDPVLYVAFGEHLSTSAATSLTWPVNVPLELTAAVDVWVSASATSTLSIMTELWATGD